MIQFTYTYGYLLTGIYLFLTLLFGPVFETSRTSEGKHVRESLRHGVTAHNWFAHYLWDIYGGFGHNGKIIQRTLPSHTQPSPSKLTAWASFRNFTHFGRETCA